MTDDLHPHAHKLRWPILRRALFHVYGRQGVDALTLLVRRAIETGAQTALHDQWQPIETAPEDMNVLVWYDHDADPCQDPHNPKQLTDYAAWAEAGPFMGGTGITIARKLPQQWETEDEFGSGYWLPSAWFVRDPSEDYETVCNPTHWRPLPTPPEVER